LPEALFQCRPGMAGHGEASWPREVSVTRRMRASWGSGRRSV
jgi:hypothetical protein